MRTLKSLFAPAPLILLAACFAACSTTSQQRDLSPPPTPDRPSREEANDPAPSHQQKDAGSWRYAQPPPGTPRLEGRDEDRSAPTATTPPRRTDHGEAQRGFVDNRGPDKGRASEAPVGNEPSPTGQPAPKSAPAEQADGEAPRGKKDGLASGGVGGGDVAADAAAGVLREKGRPPPQPVQPVQPERPGLATSWGETRYSAVSEVPFNRMSESPTFSVSLWYNDRTGAENMARYASGYAAMDRAVTYLARGLAVSLRDEYGAPLPGFRANGRIYAIGENGRRYSIVIENRTNTRFELLASVDGLDVLDGRAASYGKRGYLIEAYGRIEIEGFRQSEDAVAAFRFGSVRNSYAKQTTGSDRNVGVIGVAAFAERPQLPYWSSRDVERRQQADPFPSKWSPPPQGYNDYPPQDMYQVR